MDVADNGRFSRTKQGQFDGGFGRGLHTQKRAAGDAEIGISDVDGSKQTRAAARYLPTQNPKLSDREQGVLGGKKMNTDAKVDNNE
ncbi:uncharacterized protein KD926_002666 [Aspergillus affinis]|uniref:uncharacterized protein n=1 Tax=Aspergillus affinis TaxID=1070780 RepID=UPI0022FDFFC2|nr:uncharacterized protein KD926_002666 [Aspergillus affinis]KAI9043776.1 hypothetical protein KD926_002666 [Aspergillus affinis]